MRSDLLKVIARTLPRLAELDKMLNSDTRKDDSAGRLLRDAHAAYLRAGGICSCGPCRANDRAHLERTDTDTDTETVTITWEEWKEYQRLLQERAPSLLTILGNMVKNP